MALENLAFAADGDAGLAIIQLGDGVSGATISGCINLQGAPLVDAKVTLEQKGEKKRTLYEEG